MTVQKDSALYWMWLGVLVLLQVSLIPLLTLTDAWSRFLYHRPSEETFGMVVLVSSLVGCCWAIRTVHVDEVARWYWSPKLASQQNQTVKSSKGLIGRIVSRVFTKPLLLAGAHAGGLCGIFLGLIVTMTNDALFGSTYAAILNDFVCAYLGAIGGAICGPIVANIYKAAALETRYGPPLTLAVPVKQKKVPTHRSRSGKILIRIECNSCGAELVFAYRDRGSVQVCYLCFAYVDVPSRPFEAKGSSSPIDLIEAIVKNDKKRVMNVLQSHPEYLKACHGAPAHLMKQAVLGDQCDMLKFLIEHGADPNEEDSVGNTLLMAASAEGQTDIVTLLLKQHVTVDQRNDRNRTALGMACSNGHFDVVKALIDAGANTRLRTNGGGTPRDLAERAKHSHIAKFIESVEKTKQVNL